MSSIATPAGPSSKSDNAPDVRAWLARVPVPRLGAIIWGLVIIALALRLWELGERAMHHDESLDAWWSWRFRVGTYDGYDPVYHGPLRFYVTAGLYELFGESEATARLFSALCGTAVVGLPWFLRHELGRLGTIAASTALCVSPTMLYYSRFAREDAQMVFLAMLGLVLGLAYLKRPRISVAAGLMFSLAASFAIKESTYLFGLLIAVYAVIVLAAQFDAQQRYFDGRSDEPERLHAGFFASAMGLASVGLIAVAVSGNLGDELFAAIALYFAVLAAFVFVVALPRLRVARLHWSQLNIGASVIALVAMAAAGLAMSRRDFGTRPVLEDGSLDWSLGYVALGALIALCGLCVVWATFGYQRDPSSLVAANDSAMSSPIIPAFGGALLGAGLLIMIGEYLSVLTPGALVILVLVCCLAIASLVAFRPQVTNPDFQWPSTLRSIGAIGWIGWGIALVVFAVTWVVCFTVFFERRGDWATGFTSAINYWDSQQEVNRGGQPWYYYLYALPAYEWLFVGLAFVGGWRALRRPTVTTGVFVWFTIGSLILYSYAGERMPWLIAHPLLPLLVVAGLGVNVLWENRHRALMPAVAVALLFGLLATTGTSVRSSFSNGADGREILSQAGQATPHLVAALERIENIDRIARQSTGESVRIAVPTSNAWPYSWYFRENPNIVWYGDEGPPRDGSVDIIIADYGTIEPSEFDDYFATLYAMRSWWVPTYTDASVIDWVSWVRDRSLWEQDPNPNFAGITEVEELDQDFSQLDKAERLGDGINDAASRWIGFAGADSDRVPDAIDPNAYVEPDDGRDGCGSVDQWFMVSGRYAWIELTSYPGPIDAMAPLACASDSFATP